MNLFTSHLMLLQHSGNSQLFKNNLTIFFHSTKLKIGTISFLQLQNPNQNQNPNQKNLMNKENLPTTLTKLQKLAKLLIHFRRLKLHQVKTQHKIKN